MTILHHSATITADVDRQLATAAVDLYRDIHKGIRAELFAITTTAGSLDPDDRGDRAALAAHVESMRGVLVQHAEHEDEFVEPLLETHLPGMAERVSAEHVDLDARFGAVADLAGGLTVATSDARRVAHVLYLELSAFTSRYLHHQHVEEVEIMPALDRIVGAPGCGAVHAAIVGSIPPDELARSLAFMLPAMNPYDRTEMLGGIRLAAPAEAFDAIVGLARSVLEPRDFALLARDLSLG